MTRMVAKRLLLAVPTLFAITALLFFGINALLGSPASLMLGQDANPAAIAALNAKYGFDQPLLRQYVRWLASALTGDFGRSYATQESVAETIRNEPPRVSRRLQLLRGWSHDEAATTPVFS